MTEYQTVPRRVEAWRWDECFSTFRKIGCKMMSASSYVQTPELYQNLRIEVFDGSSVSVRLNDFIVKHENGTFEVYDPKAFYSKYQKVEVE